MGARRDTTEILAAADLVLVAVAVWATVHSWVPNEMGGPTFVLGPTLFTAIVIVIFGVGLCAWVVFTAKKVARGVFVATMILAMMAVLSHVHEFA
jgi:hypothetical protein